jgi:hypothetical protein
MTAAIQRDISQIKHEPLDGETDSHNGTKIAWMSFSEDMYNEKKCRHPYV